MKLCVYTSTTLFDGKNCSVVATGAGGSVEQWMSVALLNVDPSGKTRSALCCASFGFDQSEETE